MLFDFTVALFSSMQSKNGKYTRLEHYNYSKQLGLSNTVSVGQAV
jgi:hypothetical protein